MSEITPEELSSVLAFVAGIALFAVFYRFVLWNTTLGLQMRKSLFFFLLIACTTFCGATKPGDGTRILAGSRKMISLVSLSEISLPRRETLPAPDCPDCESTASVGFKREAISEMVEVAVSARCVNTGGNSLEIAFETDVVDGSRVDMMIGLEDGEWICSNAGANGIVRSDRSAPHGVFDFDVKLTLDKNGDVAVCTVIAGGYRDTFLEDLFASASPRGWRKVTVYSRNGDGAQPWIEVDLNRVGLVIKIK